MRVVFRRLLAGEPVGPEHSECLVLTRSGDERVIAWHDQLLRDKTGRVTGILSSGEDVTERRQAELALRESEERFRQTAENVPDGLLVVDGRQVIFVNRRLEEILGFSRGEIRQMGMLGPIAPEDRQRVMQELTGNVQRGVSSFNLEFKIVRKDGTRGWVQCRYALGSESGQTPRHYIIITDATERKQAEERIVWLATFPEMNPDPVLEVDVSGRVTYWNSAVTECLKRLKLQHDPKQFLPVDLPEMLKRIRAGETLFLTREITLGGEVFLESVNSVQAQNTLRIYAREITAIRQAEEAPGKRGISPGVWSIPPKPWS